MKGQKVGPVGGDLEGKHHRTRKDVSLLLYESSFFFEGEEKAALLFLCYRPLRPLTTALFPDTARCLE